MAAEEVNGTATAKPRDPNFLAGYSRFEIELEFVQSLSNPEYLQHLAANRYFEDPAFVAYVEYLDYFRRPEYLKYLIYPGPTLRVLELLQQEQFRKDIINPGLVEAMKREGFEAAVAGLK